ncbi:M24 family metallopeptidase [archaeon]|nr:MAG: M24 family metallopeptidase [archaeon]
MVKGNVSPKLTVPDGISRPEYWLTGQPAESPSRIKAYSANEIPKLRKSARLARKILEYALKMAVPGMSLDYVDRLAHKAMVDCLCYPSPLNYYGFPKSICTSVNEVACHGIPDDYILKDGDIIKIDVSLYHDGYHGDNCGTVVVGENPDPKLIRLIDVTKEAVQKAIAVCEPGR